MKVKCLIPWPRIMVFAALLCVSISASAQSTDTDESILLSASSFALVAGAAITSTGAAGTTIDSGNIGLYATAESAITGFPPATIVLGSIIDTGPVTAQAGMDFIAAAKGLAAMPSGSGHNLSTVNGGDLGGEDLDPGVYTFSGAAALTGTLTLNAQGKNNVFWVIQIGTALTTAANSAVTVINAGSNGGSDDGIFWVAGSAITFGAGSIVLGNYFAGTSIAFGSGTSGVGGASAYAQAAISLDANLLNSQGGPDGSDWTGGLTYDANGNVVPIPEPAAFLWLAPLGAMGFALKRRQTRGNT